LVVASGRALENIERRDEPSAFNLYHFEVVVL
jgi:hypothetical protein